MASTDCFLHFLSTLGPRITLIGMSGIGKSHWSRLLEVQGFRRFCCDNLIADRLLGACDHASGKVGCLGRWMGLPFEAEYEEKERTYLAAETRILMEIAASLETSDRQGRVVIDATGSAPYTGDEIMQRLRKVSCIVHLETSRTYTQEVIENYIRSPRPLVWGGRYRKHPCETEHEALSRSYRELLIFRESLYRKYAHHSVPYPSHRV